MHCLTHGAHHSIVQIGANSRIVTKCNPDAAAFPPGLTPWCRMFGPQPGRSRRERNSERSPTRPPPLPGDLQLSDL